MTLRAIGAMVLAMAVSGAAAAAELKDCNVQVRLDKAAGRSAESLGDLTLELQVRGGQWQKEWVLARGLNQGRHTGRITGVATDAGATTLTVELRVKPDLWVGGGRGNYTIALKPAAGGFDASYTGTFTVTDEAKPMAPLRRAFRPQAEPGEGMPDELRRVLGAGPKQPDAPAAADARVLQVSGKATVTVRDPWPGIVKDFVPVEPGEHPRLIFRRSEMETLRKNAQTPEGKAIMERALSILEYRAHNGNFKFDSWPAIGYGFAWQMTGEQKYADRAREIIDAKFFQRAAQGGQDIHHAPQLQGLALAFDLCYDAWDAEFRRRCIDEIWQRTQECHTGTFGGSGMGGTNWAYWSNHNGIRAAAAGLGALVLLGEKDSAGRVFGDDVREIALVSAYDQRGWLEDGCGGGQWFMEGVFYKGMTMVRGLSHFLHAYAKVTGQKINTPGLRDDLIVGYFLEAEPGKLFGQTSGIDEDDLVEVIWTIGLSEVPAGAMPGVKWLLERNVGLQGNKTFGLARSPYAPYLMACYPFDVQARPPAECFPWISPDPVNGHWVFRNAYKDKDDILLTWNLLSGVRASCHYERVGNPAEWLMWGLGQQWLKGTYHPAIKGKEGLLNKDVSGPKTLAWQAADRVAVMKFDVAPAYMPQLMRPKGSKASWDDLAKQAKAQAAAFYPPWRGGLADHGIRGTRHVAVDFSGASGAPMLLVIVEDLAVKESADAQPRPAEFTWALPWAGGTVTADGQMLKVTKGNATLSGVVVGGTPMAKGAYQVAGGRLVAVLTLQTGEVPRMKVEGDAANARITVGQRVVLYDGTGIRCQTVGKQQGP